MCAQKYFLRRPRRWLLPAAWLWLPIALLPAVPVRGQEECPCSTVSTRAAYRDAELVFVGRVIDVEQEGLGENDPLLPVLEVRMVWKGTAQDRLQVFGGETCPQSYRPGKDYLVFARRDQGELVADLCSGSKRVELAARDLRELGPPRRVLHALRPR